MADNMEGVQREDRSIIARLRRALSGVILGAASGLGAGCYNPSPRLDRRTYQGQEVDINLIITPSVPPIGGIGGETIGPGISNGEIHDSPQPEMLESYTHLRDAHHAHIRDILHLEDIAERGGPARTGVVGRVLDRTDAEEAIRLLSNYNLMAPEPTITEREFRHFIEERQNHFEQAYFNPPRRNPPINELLEFESVQRSPWRPRLPEQWAGDVEYLAAGDQKLSEKPAVSVAGTPVTFWKGPLMRQHGTVECEYFGGVRSMMRVKLQKPLSFEEFAAGIPLESRAKEVWDNAKKSSYVQDDKLAYFTVPWSELVIDASPEYLESRKVRAEVNINNMCCSGTVHSIKKSNKPGLVTNKYVIELDEPVKGPKQKNYSIVAISKCLVRPIRTDTEKYIEMTVKGNPEQGCTLKHENMEIS